MGSWFHKGKKDILLEENNDTFANSKSSFHVNGVLQAPSVKVPSGLQYSISLNFFRFHHKDPESLNRKESLLRRVTFQQGVDLVNANIHKRDWAAETYKIVSEKTWGLRTTKIDLFKWKKHPSERTYVLCDHNRRPEENVLSMRRLHSLTEACIDWKPRENLIILTFFIWSERSSLLISF